ncbi:hypothetical protein LWC34_23665 [Kibdelosporangium philippinense]|uniref:Uncharacterized protein n=1 Tax=Kibdelosporangium philippinense TaxID=211113 RepID=A0ABS8ZFF1_9PSEU|nr:hypothetical protein [Kibdelosporangium philippinense]MCE7005803.1 hypothetical protein [Kibdelosporangium philippinense]
MAHLMIRYTVPLTEVSSVRDAVHAAFKALNIEQPQGIRYAYLRSGEDFIALLDIADGVENPLPGIEAARELQSTVAKAATVAPTPEPFELLGAYRML